MNNAIVIPLLAFARRNLVQKDKAGYIGAFVALIIIGSVICGKSFMSDGNLEHAKQEVAQIAFGVRALYADQSGFSGLNNSVVIRAKILRSNKINSNNTISTPYGGNVAIKPSTTDASAFDVIITRLGNGDCAKLATELTAQSVTSDCNTGPKQNIIKLLFRKN